MPKLTDRQKKKIIADYVENGNYSETARLNNTTDTTVRTIIKENKNITLKKIEQKKDENTEDMLEYLQNKKDDKKRVVELCFRALEDKLASPDMFTSVKDIITVYGIIADKELKYADMMIKKNATKDLSKVELLLSKIEEEANK